jgi:hypothetical protein
LQESCKCKFQCKGERVDQYLNLHLQMTQISNKQGDEGISESVTSAGCVVDVPIELNVHWMASGLLVDLLIKYFALCLS